MSHIQYTNANLLLIHDIFTPNYFIFKSNNNNNSKYITKNNNNDNNKSDNDDDDHDNNNNNKYMNICRIFFLFLI